jgi:hypothetical protein
MNVRCTLEAGGSAKQNARRASAFIQNRYGGYKGKRD